MDSVSYQQLLSEVIKKNIQIFGPSIMREKLSHVHGIKVDTNGNVTQINASSGEITETLIIQLMQLSSPLAKKTLQPLLDFQQNNTKQS